MSRQTGTDAAPACASTSAVPDEHLAANESVANRRLTIAVINDWEIINRRTQWNWECFHVIEVYGERDNVCRTLDLRLALLGLGVKVSINLPDRFFPENGMRDRTFEIADALRSGADD